MKNPLSFRVESSLGAVFISLLGLFFVGLLFASINNFESDVDVMTSISSNVGPKGISQTERILMQDWVTANSIEIPKGSGYKYLLRKYPDHPWMD